MVCRSEIWRDDRGDLLDRGHRRGGVALDGQHPLGDVLGRLRRLLRQLLDLVGDDREALAGLAGPGRLDGGVQRQQVGLLGDRGDHLDDVADLGRGLAQLGDGGGRGLGGASPRGRRPRWPPRRSRRSPGSRHPSARHPRRRSARCATPPRRQRTRRPTGPRSPPPRRRSAPTRRTAPPRLAATASAESATAESTSRRLSCAASSDGGHPADLVALDARAGASGRPRPALASEALHPPQRAGDHAGHGVTAADAGDQAGDRAAR